jgi:hypothetical protein
MSTNTAAHRVPSVATAAVFAKSTVWILKTLLVWDGAF